MDIRIDQMVDWISVLSLSIYAATAFCAYKGYSFGPFQVSPHPSVLTDKYTRKEPRITKATITAERANNFVFNEEVIKRKVPWISATMMLLVVEAVLLTPSFVVVMAQGLECGLAGHSEKEDVMTNSSGKGDEIRGDSDLSHSVEQHTIEVHEEELAAATREVERGEVRIDKKVVQEQQTFEVPVTEEEVTITRRRVDRPVTADDQAFVDATFEVPLRGEEVDIEKRARVVEEIDVDKVARTHTERVSDSVRREEVTIEGDNVDFDRDNTRTRNNDVDPI